MIFKDELPLNHAYSFEHLVNAWALDNQEEHEECYPDLYTTNLDYYLDWAYNFLREELTLFGLEWA